MSSWSKSRWAISCRDRGDAAMVESNVKVINSHLWVIGLPSILPEYFVWRSISSSGFVEREFGLRISERWFLASFLHRPQMNLGLIAQVLWRELLNWLVRFNELLLLARTFSSGRCLSGANQFSLSRTHVKLVLKTGSSSPDGTSKVYTRAVAHRFSRTI